MTDRFFPDIVAYSPDGSWRLSARATEQIRGPFQSAFTYELESLRGESQRGWFLRSLPEGPPVKIYLSDDPWVVVMSARSALVAIDPEGRVVTTFPLLVPGRVDRGVQLTTAGKFWTPAEIGFRLIDDRACFVVLTTWGRWIALDLSSGRQLEPKPETQRLLEEEAQLKRRFDREPWPGKSRGGVAALDDVVRATELRLRSVLGWLRALEKDSNGLSIAGDDGLTAVVYPVRQLARAGLRRLEQPTELGFPPVTIQELPRAAAVQGAPAAPTVIGAELLTPGMTMQTVLQVAGPPEHLSAAVWSYDVDVARAARASTVSVGWDVATATVATVQFLPPYWETIWPDRDLLRQCAGVLRD